MYKLGNRTNYALSHIFSKSAQHPHDSTNIRKKLSRRASVARRTTLARGGEPRIILTENELFYLKGIPTEIHSIS